MRTNHSKSLFNEDNIREIAAGFEFPPTPDIGYAVMSRLSGSKNTGYQILSKKRLLAGAVLILLIGLALMSVPAVRAQILEFFQIGVIKIFPAPPSPVEPVATAIPTATSTSLTPTPQPLPAALPFDGEMSLEEARARASIPVKLPAYPEELGDPDFIFFQDLQGDVVILVWMDEENPDEVRLGLHIYEEGSVTGYKWEPVEIQQTHVNGHPALWAVGPYVLALDNGEYTQVRMIEGHVLVWSEGTVTYRLETDLPVEEAVRIAESLE